MVALVVGTVWVAFLLMKLGDIRDELRGIRAALEKIAGKRKN